MLTLLDTLKHYATNHDGQFPTDWGQVTVTSKLPGDLALTDFELCPRGDTDFHGGTNLIRLRVPVPKPDRQSLLVVGGVDSNGVLRASTWNVNR
jgi:hypothetical protein